MYMLALLKELEIFGVDFTFPTRRKLLALLSRQGSSRDQHAPKIP